MKIDWKYELGKRKEKMALWFVRRLPRWIVYWCAIRLGASATTGTYGDQIVPEMTFMDTLKRWENVHKNVERK